MLDSRLPISWTLDISEPPDNSNKNSFPLPLLTEPLQSTMVILNLLLIFQSRSNRFFKSILVILEVSENSRFQTFCKFEQSCNESAIFLYFWSGNRLSMQAKENYIAFRLTNCYTGGKNVNRSINQSAQFLVTLFWSQTKKKYRKQIIKKYIINCGF